jgi:2,3-bisphosphoglycerate-dependent phosphoglycerate mutase
MSTLVLVRHGQSTWNAENLFTGWVDVPLSEVGVAEAQRAGALLADAGVGVDRAFTSTLRRAIETGKAVLAALGQSDLHQIEAWQLNERYYGALTGRNKRQTAEEFGDEQVRVWRRSFDVPPPGGESLKDTAARVLPYVEREIFPALREVGTVLVAAHGNSLRAMVKELEGLSAEEIPTVEIATGVPVVYDLDASGRVTGKQVLTGA